MWENMYACVHPSFVDGLVLFRLEVYGEGTNPVSTIQIAVSKLELEFAERAFQEHWDWMVRRMEKSLAQ